MTEEFISAELADHFETGHLFQQVDKLSGEVFRQIASRRTIRTRIGEHYYFAKIHHGVGWKEIFKNLVQGRLPILGARNEWEAIRGLEAVGVRTMTPVLFCETGVNPAQRQSAILTKSLDEKISLEDFEPDDPTLKRQLIRELAMMSKSMHEAGINHRDYYLCHFLMDSNIGDVPVLHLIDLHRAQHRNKVPSRWREKDLGGLLFSALEKQVTRRDLLRFIRRYSDKDLRSALEQDQALWRKVVHRARRLYLQDHDQLPPAVEKLLRLK